MFCACKGAVCVFSIESLSLKRRWSREHVLVNWSSSHNCCKHSQAASLLNSPHPCAGHTPPPGELYDNAEGRCVQQRNGPSLPSSMGTRMSWGNHFNLSAPSQLQRPALQPLAAPRWFVPQQQPLASLLLLVWNTVGCGFWLISPLKRVVLVFVSWEMFPVAARLLKTKFAV